MRSVAHAARKKSYNVGPSGHRHRVFSTFSRVLNLWPGSELSTLAALNLWAALNLCPNSPGCHWGRWLLTPLCHQEKGPRGLRREKNMLAADEQIEVNTTRFKISAFVSYYLTPSRLRISYCKSSREQRGRHCALPPRNLSAETDYIGSL